MSRKVLVPLDMTTQKITNLGDGSANKDAANMDNLTLKIATDAVLKAGSTMTGDLALSGASALLVGKTAAGIATPGTQTTNNGISVQVTNDSATVPNFLGNKVGAGVASATPYIHFRIDNSTIGQITRNAATSAVLYTTTSDYRLKNEHGLITDAVDRVMHLVPRRISWKDDLDGVEQDGFFAHEVARVVPDAVVGEKDAEEYQQMDASRLIPLLTAAVQELVDEVVSLKARVTELEAI